MTNNLTVGNTTPINLPWQRQGVASQQKADPFPKVNYRRIDLGE